MKIRRSLLLCLFFALTTVLCQAQDDDLLDLTTYSPPEAFETTRVLSGPDVLLVYPPRGPKISPLKVTLVSLNHLDPDNPREVVYEVALENISGETMVIPWSPDHNLVKPLNASEPPGYVEAFITLIVKDSSVSDDWKAFQPIYGSSLVTGSLKALAPGHVVRIKAHGELYFYTTDVSKRVSQKRPLKFQVGAVYGLYGRTVNPRFTSTVGSVNSFPITLPNPQN
ncbi:MAG TPA: hypothetical protein VF708_16840 [Pyrinomonadaceae bacterium]|jgi:hypothetical protein